MTLPGPSAAKRQAVGGRDLTLSPRTFADFVKKLTVSVLTWIFFLLHVGQQESVSFKIV